MTYSQRVKASKEIVERMEGLPEGGTFTFKYKEDVYTLSCYSVYTNGRRAYSIDKVGHYTSGMNIEDKIGPTTLTLYTYDMMGQRATYKMPMYLMEVITPIEA